MVDPLPSPPLRPYERLAEEMKLVERALRMPTLGLAQAEAYASKGARLEDEHERPRIDPSRFMPTPHGRPECTDRVCRCPNVTGQRFEADVIRFVDRAMKGLPLFVVQRLPGLFFRLPWQEQMVLELVVRRGMTYRQAAEWRPPSPLRQVAGRGQHGTGPGLGIEKSRIAVVKGLALERLARQLWRDDGSPIYE